MTHAGDDQRNRRIEAEKKGREFGATTPIYYVLDDFGGYWQCGTAYGPYTFRLQSAREGGKS